MTYSLRVFNKTGERFYNEGEYADSSGFTINSGSAYSSQENGNKLYKFPSYLTQEHFFERKPLDCGSMKILSNNISHLIYQKCRTLAVTTGPGTIGYDKSDLNLVWGDPDSTPYVTTPFPRNSSGLDQDRYKEIGWSKYSSRRLGPFYSVVDRKLQYEEAVDEEVPLPNNSSCIRKMVLVINGYKQKMGVGAPDEEGVFRIHACVTSDGGSPMNPEANIIPLCAEERGWIEGMTTTVAPSVISQPIPATANTPTRAIELQGLPAYTVDLQQDLGDDWYGKFKLFIPINCIGDVDSANASPGGIDLFQCYVHVGWYVGHASSCVGTISLLEVRDPGTSEAS